MQRDQRAFASLQQQQRWLCEVEASELLTHDSDVTEATMTGGDEAAAWAYGGDYYMQEQHLSKLARLHSSNNSNNNSNSDDGSGRSEATRRATSAAADTDSASARMRGLVVNTAMAQPRFFRTGNDFPAVTARRDVSNNNSNNNNKSSSNDDDDEAQTAVAAAAMWSVASGADMDIIVPVVSSTCALAVSASNGSSALAELKRLLAREKANRAAADTSKSQLTRLLRKDALGRTHDEHEEQQQHYANGDDGGSSTSLYSRSGRDVVSDDADGEAARQQRDAEEAARLRRRLRIERERLATNATTEAAAAAAASSSHTHHNNNNNNNDDDDDDITGDGVQQRRLRKLARLEQIASAEQEAHAAATARDDDNDNDAYAEQRARLRAQQRALPIYACKEALLRCIGENAVTVVVGETGSGKTTQLVQYLYERGYARDGLCIGCTQPRRLAAVGVAQRVSDELGCVLGSVVGYAIHLDDMTSPATAVKFMTDGVLLREMVHDARVSRYSVVILDEAHERSVDTDVLMGVLKRAVQQRAGALKLVVTSATMDVARFSRFFAHAPHFTIAGRTFPVSLQYTPEPVSDYVAEAVFRVCQLHVQAPLCGAKTKKDTSNNNNNNNNNDNDGDEDKHDILVFMTGADDVYGTCELIRRRLRDLDAALLDTLLLVPCLSEAATSGSSNNNNSNNSSSYTASACRSVLEPTPHGMRKCVVATNVAETSLTIDGVRYVIDCGFMKTNVFRPKIGMNTLQRYPVSQAQAQQRAGRAGRTCAGVCYRLYTEAQFAHEMLVSSVPEIQRCSVESVVLLLKSIGVRRLVDFDFMDAPPVANVRSSMWHLWMLGLLDDDGDITADGRVVLEFPVAPALATMLVHGTRHGCAVEVARVVAVVAADAKRLFDVPATHAEEAARQHGYFAVADSDHLTLLNVLTQFVGHGQSRAWAQDHYLHAPTLLRACDVLQQLLERLRRLRLPVTSCRHVTTNSNSDSSSERGVAGLDVVRYCVCKALCTQAAQRVSSGSWNEYRPLINAGVTCQLHPSSSLCGRVDTPTFVVYHDLLLLNGKEYLVLVTAVAPEWLVECGRGLYMPRRGVLPNSSSNSNSSLGMQSEHAMAAVAAAAAAAAGTSSTAAPPSATPRRQQQQQQQQTGTRTAATSTTRPRFASLSQRRRDNV